MQVSDPNNVKIYNLSAGKSLPEWLSDRKRRSLLKKNVDIRRRIELIQDFDMPGVSTSIKVSKDGQYVIATGIYKPRVKCFDVNNLSLKFERCFDSEAITFEILSDDYSKLVFLQCDRYIEFHASQGRYYRLRIPKFGRDMKYHFPTCDLYIVGASSDIYRVNLERGQFMTPFTSKSFAMNKCAVNEVHNLIVCGNQEGRVEAWDPRSKCMIGSLDCAFSCVNENKGLEGFPSVTALKFNGGLQMAVGTATGQVLLYDIRSDKPFHVKDHMYGQPIKDVDFHHQEELVYSMDASVVKIWDKNNGKLFTSIPAQLEHNNLCVIPNTGLLFIANEHTKMQTYYIPSLGPAPKWASFLDNLTEELEESNGDTVYDDYKFVTRTELEALGLDHLVGTQLLRAYMHGYFMDVRLYKKAKSVANPFEFKEFRKKKIRETIEAERVNRVQVNKLPKVNKDLALKLMSDQLSDKKKRKANATLLQDDRFKSLFDNPDFEVDKNADEYRLLNPVLARLDNGTKKMLQKRIEAEFEPVQDELEGKNSSDEDSYDESDDNKDYSSDDEHTWTKDVKKQYRMIQRDHRDKERTEEEVRRNEASSSKEGDSEQVRQPRMFALRSGEEFKGMQNIKRRATKISLGDRLKSEEDHTVKTLGSIGNREMIFSTVRNKRDRAMNERNERHRDERKKLMRPTFGINKNKRPNFRKRK